MTVAERGLSLLEKKLHILEQELERLHVLAAATGRDWHDACLLARTWQLRSMLLGGQQSLLAAAASADADITVRWTTITGIRYPCAAECQFPQRRAGVSIIDSVTLVHARTAHESAVAAAARHAAAAAAVDILEHEVTATRIRVQGLRRRRLPTLRAELERVELELDEQEHAESIRLRWATRRSP